MKRYATNLHIKEHKDMTSHSVEMIEWKSGEWVKWEDVKQLLDNIMDITAIAHEDGLQDIEELITEFKNK